MKTTKIYSASLLILTLILVTGLNATALKAASSADNPPASYNEYKGAIPGFDFEEEAYIDDIPFDTECVTKDCLYEKAVSEVFDLPDEAYIEDIPFNTAKVAKQIQYQNTSKNDFQFEEEKYIDDIPFDTHQIVYDSKSMTIFVQCSR